MGNLRINLKRVGYSKASNSYGLMWVISYGSYTVSVGKKRYNHINLFLNGCRIPARLWNVVKYHHRLQDTDSEYTIVKERVEKSRTRLCECCTELLRLNNLNRDSLTEKLSSDSIWRNIFNLEGLIYNNDVAVTDWIDNLINTTDKIQPATKNVYKALCSLIKQFEASRKVKYSFVTFNLFVYNSFVKFIENNRQPSSVVCYLGKLKTAFEKAYQEGLNVTDEYRRFKYTDSSRRDNNKSLTKEQVDEIRKIKFSGTKCQIKQQEMYRDMFLIEVELGCRYSDYGQLKRENIIHTEYQDAIVFEPQKQSHNKTCKKAYIPLTPIAKEILEKYDYNLERCGYNGYNDFLTKLGTMIGITPKYREDSGRMYGSLSSHWGRHTFITNALARGMREEDVMAITGHKSLSAFRVYAHTSDEDQARNTMKKFYESLTA